jgi:NADH-quinone oxidoreductase subunit J
VIDPVAPYLFYAAAAMALLSAIAVVAQRNPIGSAFALIVTLCSLSIVYGLLGSPFIAVLQIVVYAGAIMVLFLFVMMLLNVQREGHERGEGRTLAIVAGALALVLLLQVGAVILAADIQPGAPDYEASTPRMARVLFSLPYLYVFEATSILILAALVGAVVLAQKEPK